MTTWIAFLRGINVGGHNKLPMKALIELLENNGYQAVKTYIQSGNVVLNSTESSAIKVTQHIQSLIKANYGFEPAVTVLSLPELQEVIQNNPFPQAEATPKSLHLFFLLEIPPEPNLTALEALKTSGETFQLKERVFYLYTPEGLGHSKLATQVEKKLGVKGTARNWNTVTQMHQLAQ